MLTNRCPKCGGNLTLEKDRFGYYYDCLQCGYEKNLGKELPKVNPIFLKK